jgi:Ureidoglycolate hydrolase
MKTIKAKSIKHEEFMQYGSFYNYLNPNGFSLQGELHTFYPDRLSINSMMPITLSSLEVKKAERMIISSAEYHTSTWEVILPMNDDMIIHVAQGKNSYDSVEAFIVPKGCAVKINAGVWHLAPLPLKEEKLNTVIILPERTYANDCTVVSIEENNQFEIII